eukprot:4616209-Pleurochrysis_carterae.AAC.1
MESNDPPLRSVSLIARQSEIWPSIICGELQYAHHVAHDDLAFLLWPGEISFKLAPSRFRNLVSLSRTIDWRRPYHAKSEHENNPWNIVTRR